MTVEATPRNLHYGQFYGLLPLDERPVLVVHGNCQAESLRVLLDLRYGGEIQAVRMVPAHELTRDDIPHLMALMRRARYVVTQPIVQGYRGLPSGTADVLAEATLATHALVPVMRWAGLHPTQVIVRTPDGEPPIVPYHDLRTIAAAHDPDAASLRITPEAARSLRDASRAELVRRTQAHRTITVDDIFGRAGRRSVHVINHPVNDVLDEVTGRLAEALGLAPRDGVDPGRVLLGSIVAPVEEAPAELAGIEPDAVETEDAVWRVAGEPVADADIVRAHLDWYRDHPQALRDAVARHEGSLRMLREAQ